VRTNPFQEGEPDGGPSRKPYIGPLTRAMAKRLEDEEGHQKTLLL